MFGLLNVFFVLQIDIIECIHGKTSKNINGLEQSMIYTLL